MKIPIIIDVVSQKVFSGTSRIAEVAVAAAYLLVARAIKKAVRIADDGKFERGRQSSFEKQAKELMP